MAEEYEVRGAHEEHVEDHAAHREPLAQRIALFSAVLATLGAVISLLGGHTENDALYYKNEAVPDTPLISAMFFVGFLGLLLIEAFATGVLGRTDSRKRPVNCGTSEIGRKPADV